ncbi:GNAT family N-acetyltransferase [Oceanirhabdus sp. W0125-5]|uniref:GNAT family N-acetyltransferase n=1 Tax=Oceanirhabdus sp. W0125-5 TaxID=2999116 RepID=UPI0022F2D4CF|nr:GNAT family N-acetyltransferase [Oceanirhabdus sp. W0125-5]WBW94864.1 GNAT family N-acetyltransferase [Oceanirhabdus sp. W0125-5]
MLLDKNIITERFILRNIVEDDAKDVWEIWSNSENEKFMGDPYESLEEIVSICQSTKNCNSYLTVATLKDTGEIIGTCCFGPTKQKNEWGLGYSIKQEHWSKGYATEIVKGVIKFGCGLRITDFVADCAIENSASGRVLQKCGFNLDSISTFKQSKTNKIFESHVYKLHVD